ncbi:hypothetical protein QSJ19_10335 [Gordonia sp. ABSL11-1]|uniref:hypothetical protein n=1 Tax=Gordonia sp. ABSL11-1 TaxID=3053924 RepID=UPI0025736B11|nr:hypothetical protein [Gordonia sp. ABSL11-1]MDL9945980.1 hypothetical protein [Gordonia sp. ABSL11-1]
MNTPPESSAPEAIPITLASDNNGDEQPSLVTAPRSELIISALLLVTTAAMLAALFTSSWW